MEEAGRNFTLVEGIGAGAEKAFVLSHVKHGEDMRGRMVVALLSGRLHGVTENCKWCIELRNRLSSHRLA